MTAEEYRNFSSAVQSAPQPQKAAATATVHAVERQQHLNMREQIFTPQPSRLPELPELPPLPPAPQPAPVPAAQEIPSPEPEQAELPMPQQIPWRFVGELYNSYVLVEQGEEAFLIDKHAAHERILFEKLKAHQERISSQLLLTPIPVRLSAEYAAELLGNTDLLDELGSEVDELGDNTVLLRQIPMDLSPEDAAEAAENLAADLIRGRRERKDTVRDELLHTVACKAAIKAGWHTDEAELMALVKQVMSNDELKYCPHGRPICITLSKKQLEKQFKRA